MTETEEELYTEYFPYYLNKVTKVFGSYRPNQKLEIEIFIKKINGFASGVTWKSHDPNPWLDKIRFGKNPGKEYFKNQRKKLSVSKQKKISLASKKFPIRWGSAGGLLILKDKNGNRATPLNLRPRSALYPNRLDANAGLSSSIADWIYPQVLGLREILEELIIIRGNTIILPCILENTSVKKVQFSKLLQLDQIKTRHLKFAKMFLKKPTFDFDLVKLKNVTPTNKKATLSLHYSGRSYKTSGLVTMDFETASIDLRNIYEVYLESFDDLVIIDGEARGKFINKSRDCEIYLFDLDVLKKLPHAKKLNISPRLTFRSGKLLKNEKYQISWDGTNAKNSILLTPVLKDMIMAMSSR